MREFQAKKRSKGWLYSKPVLLLLLVIFVFMARVLWNLFERYLFTKNEREKIELVLAELEDREDDLTAAVAMLDTPEGTEKVVREKFAVAKPGEFVVNIIDKNSSATPTTTAVEKKIWWREWFED